MVKKSQQAKKKPQWMREMSRWVRIKYNRIIDKFKSYERNVTRVRFLFCLTLFFFALLIVFSLSSYIWGPFCWPSSHDLAVMKFIGSALGLVLGFLLFAQRLDTMNQQAKTAQDQVKATQNQHESEQFKQACELLAHENMVTRLGGVTLLGALAQTKPERWYIRIDEVLKHFIRQRSAEEKNPSTKSRNLKANEVPADIKAAEKARNPHLTDEQHHDIQTELAGIKPDRIR